MYRSAQWTMMVPCPTLGTLIHSSHPPITRTRRFNSTRATTTSPSTPSTWTPSATPSTRSPDSSTSRARLSTWGSSRRRLCPKWEWVSAGCASECSGGFKFWTSPWPNVFFHAHAVSRKFWPKNRLTPPLLGFTPPLLGFTPLGNSGFTDISDGST